MKIKIDIDDDKLKGYIDGRGWCLIQDALEEALEQVALEISEPGATEGKILMLNYGSVGTWEIA